VNKIIYQIRYALPVWFCMLITAWLPDNRVSIRIRGFLVSLFLPNNPKGLTIGRDVTLLGIDKLKIENNVYFAKGVWINALGNLTIKDEVMLGPYVVLVTTSHGFVDNSVYKGKSHFKPVVIGKGTWVAANCTITSGITIGSGCIVGANSVVTKSVPDNHVVAGTPARYIKENRV
jgi:acetyltransferase-like isoleucine patch superfamily enzyme